MKGVIHLMDTAYGGFERVSGKLADLVLLSVHICAQQNGV